MKLHMALALDVEVFEDIRGQVEKSYVLINTLDFFGALCSAWLKVRPFVSIIKCGFIAPVFFLEMELRLGHVFSLQMIVSACSQSIQIETCQSHLKTSPFLVCFLAILMIITFLVKV